MSNGSDALIAVARKTFHRALLDGPLTCDPKGIPSIADVGSATSCKIAKGLVALLGTVKSQARGSGQRLGRDLEHYVADFLRATFLKLLHLRPGEWEVFDKRGRTSGTLNITNFEQYDHLARLTSLIRADRDLASTLGSDYLITPDVVILRRAEDDARINAPMRLVDQEVARLTPLRRVNHRAGNEKRLLHASISCKWTIRSDRAQNARSEALNLIRNRKGRVPHITAVTAEPLPMRIASLALGTSDLDCVYHIALPELRRAVGESSARDQEEQLQTLVTGKRLRDIADLPLDLAI